MIERGASSPIQIPERESRPAHTILACRILLWHSVCMQHEVHVCPNGLTVLAAARHAVPLVSVQVWVGTGSMLEGAHAGSGISHLLEHQVFKGTAEFNGETLNRRVPELGGSWNAYTSTDRTVYHINGPAQHWREFLHLLVQLVFHPAFPQDDFERERDVIRREMDMYADDPQDAAYHALVQTLYKAGTRRLPVIGERARFDALTHADMVAYHRERYVPGNMFICVAGDVDPAELFAAVQRETADVPPAPLPQPALPPEPRQWGPRTFRREFAQPTSTLMLAWRIPHSNHPDAAALTMLASILGDGRAAWLYKRFHDELGLAHDISAYAMPDRHGEGAFVVEADVERERRDTLRDALLEYMETLPRQAFNAAMARCRKQLLTARLRVLSKVQGVADTLGMAWHLSRNGNCMDEWDAALANLDTFDLIEATEYFTRDRLCEVSVDPVGSNPPAAAAEEGAVPQEPQVCTLPNGMRLVTRVDRRVPLMYATLALAAGCPTETAQNAGINSLLAECLLKGTSTRSAADLAEAVEKLGGGIRSDAGNNTLTVSVDGMAADAETLLSLLADAVLHPVFPAASVETEKEAMVADILDAEEDPAALAFRRARKLCFGDVSYGNHPDGSVESVQALTREALLSRHARLACAQNAVLAVTGDIDPAAIRAAAERLFSPMPAGRRAQGTPTPPQQPADAIEPSDKEQAVLVLALPAGNVTDPHTAEQMLFCEWCRDMAGPLFAEIRENRGLAYYTAATPLPGVDAGCIFLYLGTAPEHAAQARAALEGIIARLAAEGMPADALERTRATLLAARAFAMQSGKKICASMAVNELLGLGADFNDRLPGLIRAVAADSMNAYIRRLLSPSATRTWMQVGGTARESR